MNTQEHNALNALVNRCCALQYEADKIIAALEGFADMQPSERDAQYLTGGAADAREANEYRKLQIERAIAKLRAVAVEAEEAAEACNSGLLF
jgi:hypothetical protein